MYHHTLEYLSIQDNAFSLQFFLDVANQSQKDHKLNLNFIYQKRWQLKDKRFLVKQARTKLEKKLYKVKGGKQRHILD